MSPMPSEVQAAEMIQDTVRRIVARFQPEKVILFGSYARGNPGPDSDVDLLVVMPLRVSKLKTLQEIYRHLGAKGLPTDVIVATPEEVERFRHVIGTIIEPALSEGKVLYERDR